MYKKKTLNTKKKLSSPLLLYNNTVLQPWTPCLPIRGGKLKTTKYYSTSNPQLPQSVSTSSSFVNNKNNSSSSLNSSYIWREASPNNFNMYSASATTLNNATYRYSFGVNTGSPEWRAADKTNSKISFLNQLKQKTSGNYENMYMTPLLPSRKFKHHQQTWSKGVTAAMQQQQQHRNENTSGTAQQQELYISSSVGTASPPSTPHHHNGLYDRRINRSFEAPKMSDIKNRPLRRSTPHLASGDEKQADNTSRHSATWCCGNFVMKQWRKINNYD